MFPRILKRIRDLVRARQYVMPLHAEEEMYADELTVFDVESAILTGEIIQRQKDRNTAEWKYVISGETLGSGQAIVVCKLGPTGKVIFITVYCELER
jgi:hypothetical protein